MKKKKKGALVSSHLAYNEMLLYVNVLVIKTYKHRKKTWNGQHRGLH